MLVVEISFDPLEEIVSAFLKQKTVPGSSAKRAEEVAESYDSGFRKGMAVTLSAFANTERSMRVPLEVVEKGTGKDAFFEGVDWYSTLGWLEGIKSSWADGEPWASDANWLKHVRDSWQEFVWPTEMADAWEKRRRAMVRTNQIEPKPSDAEWLREELDKQRENLTPLEQLIAKAEKANTGSIRGLGVAGNPDR